MKQNKTARDLRRLASRAYLHPWSGRITDAVSDEEQIAFHKMHQHFIRTTKNHQQAMLLADRYPFLKIDNAWYVSVPKLYLWLFAARSLISQFEDEDMRKIYDGIQSASKYHDKAVSIDRKLTPHGHSDYEDYQLRLAELYKEYETEQLELFGDVKPVTPDM